MTETVPLIRWFTPIRRAYEEHDVSLDELWPMLGRGDRVDWQKLRERYRTIILADAGAGKTFELRAEAQKLADKERPAFFIRIEDIDASFGDAFEVGTSEAFEAWLAGTSEAWFFLDSVDEVRLDEPRAFENAIRAFSARIHGAFQRAHVYISSRPYAWRLKDDRALIEELLPYDPPVAEATGEEEARQQQADKNESALDLYSLAPLDADDIRSFAGHRGVADADALLAALERTALFPLARLPFDLEDILETWRVEKSLDSRLAVLGRGIRRRLSPPRTLFGSPPLSLDRALEGARILAMAATLTSATNIRMPDHSEAPGINAAALLKGWNDKDVTALLSRGIFSDAIYGMVRFRHREVRELLAAEWFASALENPAARPELEGLIFREVYGESIIVPRLRAILPWLILLDEKVRHRALALHPEIATEGGDAAQLPLAERQKILADIVERIVSIEQRGGDNGAIARIAQRDLGDDALQLIRRHRDNDDAIFFLGRLVWQGEMNAAAEALGPIARDPKRGIYARLVSARAVATICGEAAAGALWADLNAAPETLPRRLLAELVQEAGTNDRTVELLLVSIGKLEPYERFEATGLSEAIHALVERLPVNGPKAPTQPLARLVEGLVELLSRAPHVERRECKVSKAFRWLMAPAMHAVERLIAGRAAECFAEPALTVLTLLPALRMWDDGDDREHASKLGEIVPRWTELNDALFWRTVAERRAILAEEDKRLDDDWQVTMRGHFWHFDQASFERTLGWITSRELEDDRKVALARTFRTYASHDRPKPWLVKLKKAVKGDEDLEAILKRSVRPPANKEASKWRANERRWEKRHQNRRETEARYRAEFAEYLKENPDLVRNPALEPGEMSQNQYNLLRIIEGEGMRMTRTQGGDWKVLIPEFGQAVAEAFRDGAVKHWRQFKPGMRSEGTRDGSIPYGLIFAMAGLEMEAGEDGKELAKLPEDEAGLALRYALWEMNGFPRWFEPLYRARPEMGHALLWRETCWELENSPASQEHPSLLHDIVYHLPWLHADLALAIADWFAEHDTVNPNCLRYARTIMVGGNTPPETLGKIARAKVANAATPSEQLPTWYAIWADNDPDNAIPAVEALLEKLDPNESTRFAQAFVVSLLGGRRESSPGVHSFRTPEHLKRLYVLMHQHIRIAEDIDRNGKGVYSPTLRDDAQDARGRLFSLLSDIPGERTYRAMLELASDHPEPDYRLYMRRQARDRAVADGDLTDWTQDEVVELIERASTTFVGSGV